MVGPQWPKDATGSCRRSRASASASRAGLDVPSDHQSSHNRPLSLANIHLARHRRRSHCSNRFHFTDSASPMGMTVVKSSPPPLKILFQLVLADGHHRHIRTKLPPTRDTNLKASRRKLLDVGYGENNGKPASSGGSEFE